MDHLQPFVRMKSDRGWFYYNMPYEFRKLRHPKYGEAYLPLNRDYMPLGMVNGKPVDYLDFWDWAVKFKENPANFLDVWVPAPGLYLFGDDPQTLVSYFSRFSRLMMKPQEMVAQSSRGPGVNKQTPKRLSEKPEGLPKRFYSPHSQSFSPGEGSAEGV